MTTRLTNSEWDDICHAFAQAEPRADAVKRLGVELQRNEETIRRAWLALRMIADHNYSAPHSPTEWARWQIDAAESTPPEPPADRAKLTLSYVQRTAQQWHRFQAKLRLGDPSVDQKDSNIGPPLGRIIVEKDISNAAESLPVLIRVHRRSVMGQAHRLADLLAMDTPTRSQRTMPRTVLEWVDNQVDMIQWKRRDPELFGNIRTFIDQPPDSLLDTVPDPRTRVASHYPMLPTWKILSVQWPAIRVHFRAALLPWVESLVDECERRSGLSLVADLPMVHAPEERQAVGLLPWSIRLVAYGATLRELNQSLNTRIPEDMWIRYQYDLAGGTLLAGVYRSSVDQDRPAAMTTSYGIEPSSWRWQRIAVCDASQAAELQRLLQSFAEAMRWDPATARICQLWLIEEEYRQECCRGLKQVTIAEAYDPQCQECQTTPQ